MIYIDGALARTPGLLCRRRRAAQRCRNVSGRGRQAPVGRSTHRHRDTETQIHTHTHTPNTDRDKRKHTRTHAQTHRRLGEAPGGLGTGPGELAGGSGRLRELREPNASSTEFYPESPRGSRKFPGARDRVRRACARLREALGDSAQGPRSFSRSLPEASGGSRTLPEAPGESGKGSGEAPGSSQKRGESGAWKYPQKSRKKLKCLKHFPGHAAGIFRDDPGGSRRLGDAFPGPGRSGTGSGTLRNRLREVPGRSGAPARLPKGSGTLQDFAKVSPDCAKFPQLLIPDATRRATRLTTRYDAFTTRPYMLIPSLRLVYDAIRRIYDAACFHRNFRKSSGIFGEFPEIFRDFLEFLRFSGDFLKFYVISRSFREFIKIFGDFRGSPVPDFRGSPGASHASRKFARARLEASPGASGRLLQAPAGPRKLPGARPEASGILPQSPGVPRKLPGAFAGACRSLPEAPANSRSHSRSSRGASRKLAFASRRVLSRRVAVAVASRRVVNASYRVVDPP